MRLGTLDFNVLLFKVYRAGFAFVCYYDWKSHSDLERDRCLGKDRRQS